MTVSVGLIVRAIVATITQIFTDWRRDRLIQSIGRREAEAKAALERARAEHRMSQIEAKVAAEVLADLERGRF